MRKLCAVLLLTTAVSAETKPVVETQFGRLKTDIAPSADFGIAIYRHGAFRIGAYSAPTAQGIIASYDGDAGPFRINLGQREKSVEQGFLISNGAYLPWTRNFAYAEASGVALETNTKWVSADALYYQQQQNNLFMSRLKLTPLSWFRLQGGIAVPELQQSQTMLPVGAVVFGKSEESAGKFYASLEAAGRGNYLTSVQYADGWLLRALAFRRNEINPLASGIYENSQGLAAQFISDFWFLQFFSAQTTYGLARYAGTYLTAIAVYEEKIQLAGFSLRNNPDGFHVRSGLTFGSDSSMQWPPSTPMSDAILPWR